VEEKKRENKKRVQVQEE